VRAETARHRQTASGFHGRPEKGDLDRLSRTATGHKYDLQRQYDMNRHGDVARRMHLDQSIHHQGGWRNHRQYGPVSHGFTSYHFGHCYPGPSLYPSRCWYPRWTSWVGWTWWDYCHPYYDPRPIFCRPIYYDPCPPLSVYVYPQWNSLPVVSSGTWVDVPKAAPASGAVDLQLLAVRFVDPGHPEKELGPRYRVWFRNGSQQDIVTPFNVMVLAANDEKLDDSSPQAGVRVESIEAGQTQTVDLRLPFDVTTMGRDADGKPAPFAQLHAWVDSHGELSEAVDENNGAMIARGDVLPVDPAAFSTDVETGVAGEMISIAGEGFGPEPGRVVVIVKGLELDAEIAGWYDLGVHVKLPKLLLAGPSEMELVVVRGDGAASNPLKRPLVPAGTPVVPAP